MNLNRRTMACSGFYSAGELAKKIGVSHTAVLKWLSNKKIPRSRLEQVEALTGIPRHELAPDLFAGYERVAPMVKRDVGENHSADKN